MALYEDMDSEVRARLTWAFMTNQAWARVDGFNEVSGDSVVEYMSIEGVYVRLDVVTPLIPPPAFRRGDSMRSKYGVNVWDGMDSIATVLTWNMNVILCANDGAVCAVDGHIYGGQLRARAYSSMRDCVEDFSNSTPTILGTDIRVGSVSENGMVDSAHELVTIWYDVTESDGEIGEFDREGMRCQ